MAKKSLSGVAFKSGPNKGKHKSAVCKGLNSGGKNKGRLKPGFKWTKSSPCPVPVAADAKPRKKAKAKRKASGGTGPNLAARCAGLHSGGKKKGKLKKGFKWKSGIKCPVTVSTK